MAQLLDTPILEVKGLSCGYGKHPILEDISFRIEAGSSASLLGPNGVGKTTLFKTILGFLPRLSGEVLLEGHETSSWSRKEYAQAVAYVPQAHETAFAFTVHDLVLMGRTPALTSLATPGAEDERICCEVIDEMGLSHLAHRPCTELSGGELQMALIARALVQMPRLLIMDEPCANLDLGNQTRVLEKMSQLVGEGLAMLVCTHDPNHAFFLDDNVICLGRDGRTAMGQTRSVLDAATLKWLYGTPIGIGTVSSDEGTATACAPVHPASQR